MSQYPYREASYRSTAHVDFEPPAWWAPHSSETHLLRETRATIGRMQDADFMTWLDDRGREGETLTFAGLWRKALAVSRKMVDDWGVETGDRVLLCYLPGMAFMIAFWGCLRLRVVAVPVYPPDPNKLALGLKKLDLVKQSCGSSLCLTEKALDQMRIALSLTHRWPPGLVWKRTDRELKFKDASDPDVPLLDDAVAFLQYTSGSTGDPKGVMLTFANANIWHNLNEMYLPAQRHHLATRGVAAGERITGVSWLPQFHDTGLVLCIVGPFVAGYRMVNFSPLTFLKMPLLWLEAMSKYGAHWSAAPDFAYELCVRRLGERQGSKRERNSQLQRLISRPFSTRERAAKDAKAKENGDAPKAHAPIDLASIRQFACGAGERCRPAQLERFMETFKPYGLREDVYVPNYGLAEHVVGTCGCARGLILSKSRPDLACCGEDFQCDLRIVDPTSRRWHGEIWISPKSVAAGYWGKKELSTETFHARLVLDDAGTESRSRYDLIIVGGKNYYPEDIEVAAQEANRDVIRPGCVAAFAAEENAAGAEEKVVCVFELRKSAPSDAATLKALTDDVARAVGVASGLQPDRVLVIPERSIPKTTSGKVQRRQTPKVQDASLKVLFDTAGVIEPMARSYGPLDLVRDAIAAFPWTFGVAPCDGADKDKDKDAPEADASPAPSEAAETRERAAPPATPSKRAAEVEATLLGAIRAVATGPVVATTAFYELGLSSRQMVELLRKIEGELDLELPPTVVFSCPTVRALAAEIVSMTGGGDDSDGEGTGAQAGFDGVGGGLSRRAPLLASRPRGSGSPGARRVSARCAPSSCRRASAGRACPRRAGTGAPTRRLARRGGNRGARAAYGAFSDGARGFEPRRYGFRPAEAAALDPQQRLLLDLTYGALVSRSPDRCALRGAAVGVCAGMMSIDAVLGVPAVDVGPHDLTGNGYAAAGSRLSFLLDLRGPCVVVDTACSGALVAAALAAKFVRDGDADAEIAGGVSLMLAPSFVHVGAAAAGMTSPSGACRAFDASADGYCRGEGCSALLLEPADDSGAPAPAWAASTCAHNGQSATFTALNATPQRRLVGVPPGGARGPARTLGAVEAHGTGTRLGDPIELGGLAAALGRSPGAVRVAGVKGCLGHGEPNAGGAGVLAALGALAGDSAPNGACGARTRDVPGEAGFGHVQARLTADGAPDQRGPRRAGRGAGLAGDGGRVELRLLGHHRPRDPRRVRRPGTR
ncbi:hypothetical protein JL720_1046 [Aureococcus anophagefferens]|nr:hypothetical protein JL720_1046 [Aureococcus anophagefferens]